VRDAQGCQSAFSVFIIVDRACFVVSQSLLNSIGEVNKHYGNSTFQFWKRAAETGNSPAAYTQRNGLQAAAGVSGRG
jgi:hypothetical protein